MKKYIVLSVNDNRKYLFYVPLTVWAWRQFGWEPIVYYYGKDNDFHESFHLIKNTVEEPKKNIIRPIYPAYLKGSAWKSETISQVCRLYACCDFTSAYLMTGDIDMIPLSDYWEPSKDKLSVYGRDLTDYHYPICYVGAPSQIWSEIMNVKLQRELGTDMSFNIAIALVPMEQSISTDKAKRWVTDQDLITERINNSKYTPERIDRGTDPKTGYPIGRVDRSAWTLKHDVFIDAHLPHDILTNADSFKKVLELLHHIWPKEDFKWFVNYYREFKKLA